MRLNEESEKENRGEATRKGMKKRKEKRAGHC